jgi:aminoglycoside 6'-N-acetyltransferase
MNTIPIPVTFERLQDSHFSLLLKWLEAPHVKAWWDQDVHWTLERIKEKYGDYGKGYKLEKGVQKPFQAYVIYGDARPLGYIQLYNAYDFSREDQIPLEGFPESLATIDIFIGEEDYVGKGLGSRIMNQFLKEYVDPYYDTCFVDPCIEPDKG